MTQRLYGIVGHPVGQARSPAVFNARFAARGMDAVMLPLEVAAARLRQMLDGLRAIENFGGLIVTVPHKIVAAEHAARRSARVALVGAANVLRPTPEGWEADLFDGIGFVQGLRDQGHRIRGRHVAVVGAGGAGLAIAQALLEEGARVSLSDTHIQRQDEGVRRLASVYHDAILASAPGESHDLAVNATPVGMADDPRIPFDPALLRAGTLVAEAIMKPPRTRLLEVAGALGLPTHEGRHMLDGQVGAIWRFLRMDELERS